MTNKHQEHGEHVQHLKINGKNYKWDEQYITGTQVRALGNIPDDDVLFLEIKKPGRDEIIENDTKIDLSKPGIEQFYSEEKFKEVVIIVNGSPKKWEKRQISFQEVIILAFGNYIDKPTMVYTVAYEDGPKQNPEGSMIKGAVVFVKNKMIFHATATDRS